MVQSCCWFGGSDLEVPIGSPLKGETPWAAALAPLRFQPDIADNVLREAPFLAETLLDGLIWRSHKSQDGGVGDWLVVV